MDLSPLETPPVFTEKVLSVDSLSTNILQSISDGFAVLDSEWRIVYLNAKAELILGMPAHDLIGKVTWDLFPESKDTIVWEYYHKAMQEQQVQSFEFYYPPLNSWFNVRAYPSPSSLTIYFLDVSAQREAELAEKLSRERTEMVLSSVDVGLWYCDLPFEVLEWDEKVKHHFWIDPAETVTIELFYDRLHPDDRNRTRLAIEESIANKTSYGINYRSVNPHTGEIRWLRATGRTFYDTQGNPIRFDGMTIDVTNEMKAKKILEEAHVKLEAEVLERTRHLSEAIKELESFSYSVSHDLRSPLRGIDGFSQALIEEYGPNIDTQGQRYLNFIREGVQKMGHLIDDLLALSRISRVALQKTSVNLEHIATDIVHRLHKESPERKYEIKFNGNLEVMADSGLMQIAMENLLNNAWKFSSKKEFTLIEFSETHDEEGKRIFTIKDNGTGFDMRFVDKLFGAFQRLHSPGDFEGSGIGLATVRRIIHRHGGKIWGISKVGEGATFNFDL